VRFIHLLSISCAALVSACATTPTIDSKLGVSAVERIKDGSSADKAEMLLAGGYYDQAAAAYKARLTTTPGDNASMFGLAEALRLGGKPAAARDVLVDLAKAPDWTDRAIESLGRVSLALGDRAGAREAFTKVTDADPKAWHSWLALAQINDLDKSWAKADEDYALALLASDQPAFVLNNHGVSMMARGEPARAVDLFRRALLAKADFMRAKTNLDLAEAASGKPAPIEDPSADSREKARRLNNYGYVAALQNRDDDARKLYEAAMKEHPSFYALAYSNLKDLDRPADAAPAAPAPAPVIAPAAPMIVPAVTAPPATPVVVKVGEVNLPADDGLDSVF